MSRSGQGLAGRTLGKKGVSPFSAGGRKFE